MEVIKKEEKYTIYKKRSGRYAIKEGKATWITGDPKVEILVKAGLVKAAPAKKKEEPKVEEAAAEATAEAPAEDPKASE
ncbi:MAG: hypothetical protein IPJ88_04085 [Myxococcales bacterium]|nr:MAG: hypothetical protein IPJ88_04085 [Myxococcales bacterium]